MAARWKVINEVGHHGGSTIPVPYFVSLHVSLDLSPQGILVMSPGEALELARELQHAADRVREPVAA